MPAISAADAISPAIRRTRNFLFRPFRLGTYLKLCLVAMITEGFGGNTNFSGTGGHHSSRHASTLPSYTHGSFKPEWIAASIAALALVMLICFFLYYLITRLRFAYFHCLIHNIREIRPGWHLYREPATRFFWLNVVVGLCFLLLMGLIALPFAAGFLGVFRNLAAGGHPNLGVILALLLPLIPIILLLILVGLAIDLILRDFMLPHFALENATAGQAWAAAWARIRNEKGSFFAYALLRILLPIVALIVLFVVLILPVIVFIAVVAVVEVAIHAAFTGSAAALGIFLQASIGVLAFGVALLVGIAFGGPLSTAIREYALIFYGGRYRPLGDILYPPPPPQQPPIIPSAPAIA